MSNPLRIALALEIHLLYKHHAQLFAGVQRYADEQGWETVIDDWVEVTLGMKGARQPRYDGVIVRVHEKNVELVEVAAKLGVPLVNVHAGSPVVDRVPGVFPDFEMMGRLRAEHLLSRGLRHFAYLDIAPRAPQQRQAHGFQAALAEAGYEVTPFEFSSTWGVSHAGYLKDLARINRWMDSWKLPVGVGMATDVLARVIVKMCQERDWRIPADVAIIGGANEERLCEQPRPSLSSLEVGYDRVGYEAARLLDDMMRQAGRLRKTRRPRKQASPTPVKPVHLHLPPVGVVARESTDFYAVDEALVANAMSYIAQQCHLVLGVSEVAQAVGVSSKTLQSRFAATLRRTVAQEIRRVRIERAKRELAAGDRSIEEIAIRSGFTSRTRMYDVFKRDLGVTPSDYRQHRKGEGQA